MTFPGDLFIKKFAMGLFILLLIGFILAPRYLVYSDSPDKADIIVQFAGPDQDTRRREALQLVREGLSEYFYIPASLSLYRTNEDKSLTSIRFPDIEPAIDLLHSRFEKKISMTYLEKIWQEYRFPRYYENTHVEMLLAKKVMDAYGFKRAIFVSSPYHMKRIEIISGRVFDSAYDITLVPSRFEKRFDAPLPSQKDMKHVFTELPKMIWFLCYDLWDCWMGVNL
ncbi:MAG: hypothetical protein ABR903_09575 [Thermodesulfovibrionales bacterium]|jgi:hypothetical protein